jgi:hypothetical protein
VTEYHFHDRDDYALHIEYFPQEELRRQFEDLLQAYQKHREFVRVPSAMDISADELKDLETKAKLARNTFYASFRDRWTSISDSVDDVAQTLDIIMVWVSQSLPLLYVNDHALHESIGTLEQCKDRLHELSSETDGTYVGVQACPWPFIRKIRLYLRAHILSKGLIIADLPGLGDLNLARQNITETYVRQCHQIFAVLKMDRAITNEGLEAVFTLARRASLHNVGIVCTRADDIKPDEAESDWPEERPTLAQWRKDIEALAQHIEALQQELTGREFPDAMEDRELNQDLVRSLQSKEAKEFTRQRYIITVRNVKITKRLEETCRNHFSAERPRVFCVSNEIYWQWRSKPVQASLPYLQLSGIMDLRRHCNGIVSDNYRSSTTRFIKEDIQALMNSVEVWIEAGAANASIERKKRIMDAVAAAERELEKVRATKDL